MPTIGLFGATGGTGRHILKLALEEGYHVQALVRTPSSLSNTLKTSNDNNNNNHEKLLVIVQGDFSNAQAIRKTVTGADYVICVAGGKAGEKSNVEMMTNFIKTLWPILEEEETKPKMFVYQSDAFSFNEKQQSPCAVKILRYCVGYGMLGLRYNILANEAVTQFMATHSPKNFKFIVTRPAALQETEQQQEEEEEESMAAVVLEASLNHTDFATISYQSMAAFTLQIMKDESWAGQCPYVNIKKTS